ncbi:MAG: GspH/FimT family pseudopilin [Candidatus Sumerlaeia bacterium]|nr:GspH/FimT family pseudopilin [Candidatus Sumerlaeia bacterium]
MTGARRGFTLLEVMIVIVIFGIVVAVAAPNLRGALEKEGLRSAARQLATGAAVARSEAVARGEPVALRIDPEERRWRIALPDAERDARGRRRSARDAKASIEKPRELGPRIRFDKFSRGGEDYRLERSSDPLEILFYPSGSSSGGVVQIVNNKGRRMSVEVSRAASRVTVWEGEPKSIDEQLAAAAPKEGTEGFRQIKSSEEELAEQYRRVASRLVQDQRRQYEMFSNGITPAEYFAQREQEGGE